MKFEIFFIFIILFSNVSALCNETQINVNNATPKELDKIIHVGNATAWKIINLRPFNSVDGLVNVSGISEGYVSDIKNQGLACVGDEKISANFNEANTSNELSIDENANVSKSKSTGEIVKSTDVIDVEGITNIDENVASPETINLVPKDIKSDENFLGIDKSNVAYYGLGLFGVCVAFLFALKQYKIRKNEF